MANFMAMALARDVHLGRLRGRRPAAARRATRGRPGLHLRPDPLLDRPGARRARASRPRRWSSSRPTTVPAAAAPVAEAIARDRAAGLTPVRDRGRRRLDEHRLGRRGRRAGRRRRGARTCGSTSTRPTAARPACRRATPAGSPDLDRADSVTVDPHKWFFQAYDIGGLLVRDGARTWRQAFGGRSPEYYRGGEAPARRPPTPTTTTTTTATSSTSTSSASRAPGAGARSSCGCPGSTSGRAASAGSIEANDDLAAHLAAALRRVRRLRGRPGRARAVGRLLPPPARRRAAAARAWPPDALDAHQDALQAALEASGDGWLTTTRLRGATWLRAGIVNYLATEADIDRLLATLRRLALSSGQPRRRPPRLVSRVVEQHPDVLEELPGDLARRRGRRPGSRSAS